MASGSLVVSLSLRIDNKQHTLRPGTKTSESSKISSHADCQCRVFTSQSVMSREKCDMSHGSAALTIRMMWCFGGFGARCLCWAPPSGRAERQLHTDCATVAYRLTWILCASIKLPPPPSLVHCSSLFWPISRLLIQHANFSAPNTTHARTRARSLSAL